METVKQLYGLRALQSAHRMDRSLEKGDIWGIEGDCPVRALTKRSLIVLVDASPHVPSLLLVKGHFSARPAVAIVGSRASDQYGLAMAQQIAEDAVALGCQVISGGAEGCDAAAHHRALELGGVTTVVVASGHDHTYPMAHEGLFERVVESGGAIVSAYWPTTPPKRHQFLQRNRVIAGLADVTVVARAAARSGAMSTAIAAHRMGKPVLAVPGNVAQGAGEGTSELLATFARAMTGSKDLARALRMKGGERWPVRHDGEPDPWGYRTDSQPLSKSMENSEHRMVVEVLKSHGELDLEGIQMTTGIDSGVLFGTLLELELAGKIVILPGERYRLREPERIVD